ncbi:Macrophage erythroblast attacher isoform 1 [Mycena sanguinolenta]|uniref:Macrophage erythroblast attacher isoform 1 n=1 Tax=Mycena sanguinolenta TaxID=230812 RepID=A0A8H6XHQ8_9AGAR|nr:Macrophage erythroblast attacher isoform 1 [Mycena sanguinolenta]
MAVPHVDASPSDTTQPAIAIPGLPEGIKSSTSTFDSISGVTRPPAKLARQRSDAARRASHNAVERLRRENLNARFLELAGLLPNLSNIRRPTKSRIVNSCIAHVHASRRHRFLASQQLRALRDECDSLRREANDWRERAGVMPLSPPHRGEIFEMILAGAELALDEPDGGSGGEDDDYGDEDGGSGARYTHDDPARLHRHRPFHAHPDTQVHPGQFQSPFAHNLPSQSFHSAGAHDGAWRDEHPWYDDHLPPHSAHEPVMRHPYMHRLQTIPHPHRHPPPPPHPQLTSPEQHPSPGDLSPLFPSPEYPYDPFAQHQFPHGQQQIFLQDGQKWEFVPHTPTERLQRKSTR